MNYIHDREALKNFDLLLKDSNLKKKVNSVKVDKVIEEQAVKNKKLIRNKYLTAFISLFSICYLMIFIIFVGSTAHTKPLTRYEIVPIAISGGLSIIFGLLFTYFNHEVKSNLEKQIQYVKLIAALNNQEKVLDQDYYNAKELVNRDYSQGDWVLKLPQHENEIVESYRSQILK